jgi:hypothetical protein
MYKIAVVKPFLTPLTVLASAPTESIDDKPYRFIASTIAFVVSKETVLITVFMASKPF